MPSRPKVPCRAGNCPALVDKGYCEKHQHLAPAKLYDRWRGSSTQRGYDYQWGQFRDGYLRRHPLCADCEAEGFVRPAVELHHVVKLKDAQHLKFEESNLMGLCKPHHSERTARGE